MALLNYNIFPIPNSATLNHGKAFTETPLSRLFLAIPGLFTSKSAPTADYPPPMTELAHTQCNLPWLEGEKRVGAEKCLGAFTAVNRDIGNYLRIGKEVGGTRVWLGVKKALSDPKPGPWSGSTHKSPNLSLIRRPFVHRAALGTFEATYRGRAVRAGWRRRRREGPRSRKRS